MERFNPNGPTYTWYIVDKDNDHVPKTRNILCFSRDDDLSRIELDMHARYI